MKAEYRKGYRQRDSVEREGYAGARSIEAREGRERDGATDLMERILDRDNLNREYKQVKRNHGAPGIDGMTVDAALPWLRENREKLLQSIREGSYKPSPVRRKEIPKPDGSGARKLGIPTVVDRVIQQALLGRKLRLPLGAKRAASHSKSKSVCQARIRPRGRN